jgi:hypothetical protein
VSTRAQLSDANEVGLPRGQSRCFDASSRHPGNGRVQSPLETREKRLEALGVILSGNCQDPLTESLECSVSFLPSTTTCPPYTGCKQGEPAVIRFEPIHSPQSAMFTKVPPAAKACLALTFVAAFAYLSYASPDLLETHQARLSAAVAHAPLLHVWNRINHTSSTLDLPPCKKTVLFAFCAQRSPS